jgi:hypothetical protein
MKRPVVAILLVAMAVWGGIRLGGFLSPEPAFIPADNLRDAMQERMTDVLRLHESLVEGKPLERKPFAAFAGLPHSEFVDDVSEYQDFFRVFDELYEGIFTAPDPRLQFNVVMQSCVACHQTVCPGPLRSMNRLILPLD